MSQDYDENQIQILEGLSAVRKRPGMYIGSTSSRGLHHLVYEIVDNAVDEALAGHCKEVTVTLYKDNSISVEDDGRGIPIGIHPQKGIPAVEVVFTILHAGGKFGGGGYKVSGGLHGVGASVVNALSEWLKVNIYNEGKIYEQHYAKGEVVDKLICIGDTDKKGTFVHFLPDDSIFDEVLFYFDTLKQHLQETAFLTKGLKINLIDLRDEEVKELTFHHEGGIKEYVEYINKKKVPIFEEIFYAEATKDDILVEVSLQYNEDFHENTYTYVNNINTIDGGTHLVGFKSGLTKTINTYGRKYNLIKENEQNLSGDDVREGLTAVVSVKIEDPQFEGQTKGKLGNSEAKGAVESVLCEYLEYFLEENPSVGKKVIEKAILASRARDAAKKARELVRRKSVLDIGRMPGKLVDCNENDPEKCEIFIVEGDSAGGSAKEARDPNIQAILPLRGKILNVEKARLDKILGNEEIKAMITAFGTGIHEEIDINKLRYHKIIIMSDADVDGEHIRTLILTFFYRFMKPLIEQGYVYIAQPPLYRVEKSNKEYYVYDDKELEEVLNKIGRDGIKPIQRYKGLGEMDPNQLWETTMDPAERVLLRVELEDAVWADEIFTQLMGENVEARRDFINERSGKVRNLDI